LGYTLFVVIESSFGMVYFQCYILILALRCTIKPLLIFMGIGQTTVLNICIRVEKKQILVMILGIGVITVYL